MFFMLCFRPNLPCVVICMQARSMFLRMLLNKPDVIVLGNLERETPTTPSKSGGNSRGSKIDIRISPLFDSGRVGAVVCKRRRVK